MVAVDNRILLYSLCILTAAIAFSIAFVLGKEEKRGAGLWAMALAIESVAWFLFASHFRTAPTVARLLVAATAFFLILSLTFKLSAIHEYRGLSMPRWFRLLPAIALAANLIPAAAEAAPRIAMNSLLFGAMTLAIGLMLRDDPVPGGLRPRILLAGSQYFTALLLLVRATHALLRGGLPIPEALIIDWQMLGFLVILALTVTASMGFILMLKHRSDQEIRSVAMIDPLTGIYNRRAFMQRAEQECAIAQRNNQPLALLMIDADHFKQINDLHGHPMGDQVLIEITRILRHRLRTQDTLGRYGGEEFCALLPGTSEQGALSIAENLRLNIATAALIEQPYITTTVSIGVAVRAGSSDKTEQEDFHCLLSAADAALYQAKHDGRNCTVMVNSLRETRC